MYLLALGCSKIPRACSCPTICFDTDIFLLSFLHSNKWNTGKLGFISFLPKLYNTTKKEAMTKHLSWKCYTHFTFMFFGWAWFSSRVKVVTLFEWQGLLPAASVVRSKDSSYTHLYSYGFPHCTQARAILWAHFIISPFKQS